MANSCAISNGLVVAATMSLLVFGSALAATPTHLAKTDIAKTQAAKVKKAALTPQSNHIIAVESNTDKKDPPAANGSNAATGTPQ
jgi:hypothetical protein